MQGGDSLKGRGTSVRGMVMEDKGMRQTDWCLCVHCVKICVCVSWGQDEERGALNPQGVCDWEGNGELGVRGRGGASWRMV